MMMGTKDYSERKFILSNIISNGLLDHGYVSYKQVNRRDMYYTYRTEQRNYIMETANKIDNYLPLPPLDDSIEFDSMPRKFMTDSYVNMVTDTFYELPHGQTFLSEKVFNAIAHGQMFVMLSPANTLQYLKSIGYQTFGDYIDESYDAIEDNFERILAVTKSFIDFATQPKEKIHETYVKCLPILQHNQTRLYQNRYFDKLVARIKKAQDEKIQTI
jgi:hypothetical protein